MKVDVVGYAGFFAAIFYTVIVLVGHLAGTDNIGEQKVLLIVLWGFGAANWIYIYLWERNDFEEHNESQIKSANSEISNLKDEISKLKKKTTKRK